MEHLNSIMISLHILSAITWIGGILFSIIALDPPFIQGDLNVESVILLANINYRFRIMVGTSIFVLVITGIYNAYVRIGSFEALISTSYGKLLLVKLALFAVMIVIFIICPKSKSCSPVSGACDIDHIKKLSAALSKEAKAQRINITKNSAIILPRVALIMGLLIILCSVLLHYGI